MTPPPCRHCGLPPDIGHRGWCPLAPEPPDRDEPLVDPEALDIAETDYQDTMIGEYRR